MVFANDHPIPLDFKNKKSWYVLEKHFTSVFTRNRNITDNNEEDLKTKRSYVYIAIPIPGAARHGGAKDTSAQAQLRAFLNFHKYNTSSDENIPRGTGLAASSPLTTPQYPLHTTTTRVVELGTCGAEPSHHYNCLLMKACGTSPHMTTQEAANTAYGLKLHGVYSRCCTPAYSVQRTILHINNDDHNEVLHSGAGPARPSHLRSLRKDERSRCLLPACSYFRVDTWKRGNDKGHNATLIKCALGSRAVKRRTYNLFMESVQQISVQAATAVSLMSVTYLCFRIRPSGEVYSLIQCTNKTAPDNNITKQNRDSSAHTYLLPHTPTRVINQRACTLADINIRPAGFLSNQAGHDQPNENESRSRLHAVRREHCAPVQQSLALSGDYVINARNSVALIASVLLVSNARKIFRKAGALRHADRIDVLGGRKGYYDVGYLKGVVLCNSQQIKAACCYITSSAPPACILLIVWPRIAGAIRVTLARTVSALSPLYAQGFELACSVLVVLRVPMALPQKGLRVILAEQHRCVFCDVLAPTEQKGGFLRRKRTKSSAEPYSILQALPENLRSEHTSPPCPKYYPRCIALRNKRTAVFPSRCSHYPESCEMRLHPLLQSRNTYYADAVGKSKDLVFPSASLQPVRNYYRYVARGEYWIRSRNIDYAKSPTQSYVMNNTNREMYPLVWGKPSSFRSRACDRAPVGRGTREDWSPEERLFEKPSGVLSDQVAMLLLSLHPTSSEALLLGTKTLEQYLTPLCHRRVGKRVSAYMCRSGAHHCSSNLHGVWSASPDGHSEAACEERDELQHTSDYCWRATAVYRVTCSAESGGVEEREVSGITLGVALSTGAQWKGRFTPRPYD
ncbi:hypothetical protein PR048_016065 [Dryococelus australis]|uniref:Uncharacterized protein n=1 Tax=Dryococelus australis TaxID=614101 RepID=A0ABQ9HIP5_9NEOP|nr:hypothetical protein PR048_016065 [Dryococelus australis]